MRDRRITLGETFVRIGQTLVLSAVLCAVLASLAAFLNGRTSVGSGESMGPGRGPVWVLGTLAAVLLLNGTVLWLRGDDHQATLRALAAGEPVGEDH